MNMRGRLVALMLALSGIAHSQDIGMGFYSECLRKKASCSGISKDGNKRLSSCWSGGDDNCIVAVKIFPPTPGEKDLIVHLQFKGKLVDYGAIGIGFQSKMAAGLFIMECVKTPDGMVGIIATVRSKAYPDTQLIGPTPKTEQVVLKDSLKFEENQGYCQFKLPQDFVFIAEDKTFQMSLKSKKYGLAVAYGKWVSGKINFHDGRAGYEGTFNWTAEGSLGDRGGLPRLIKAHAILMTLAYVTFIPLATIIARFFKETWSKHTFLNKRLWFWLHTSLLYTTLLFVWVAYICMVYREDWFPSHGGGRTHAVLGMTSMALMVTQTVIPWIIPISLLKIKKIYSMIHTFIGFATYTLGILNIALIDFLIDGYIHCQVTLVSFLWIGLHASMYIFFTTLLYINDHDIKGSGFRGRAFVSYPLKMQTFEDAPGSKMRFIFLGIYVTISVIMSITHICMILA